MVQLRCLNMLENSFIDFTDNSTDLVVGSAILTLSKLCVTVRASTQVLFANNVQRCKEELLNSSVIKIIGGSICIKNNTTSDVGGELYNIIVVQPNAPCFFYPKMGTINGIVQFEDIYIYHYA